VIYISASSLKAFNDCMYKIKLRREKAARIITASQVAGLVVHDAIEHYSATAANDVARILAERLTEKNLFFYPRQSVAGLIRDSVTCVNNYKQLREYLPESKGREVNFRFNFSNNAEILGRFDELCYPDVIVDYKTTKRPPTKYTLAYDLQATFYTWAYKHMYGVLPEYYYVHLFSARIYKLVRTDFRDLISNIENFIFSCSNDFLPRQPDGYKCGNCEYRENCAEWGKNSGSLFASVHESRQRKARRVDPLTTF